MRDNQTGSIKLGSQIVALPTISIIMPLFNKEKEVSRAVQSVLNQTVWDFELLVVNDGSTDKGPYVVRGIGDPRIRLIEQGNSGVSAARNRGIQEARGGIVAFLDADDEWMPDFLETILRLKQNYPSCSVFATNYTYRDVDGSFIPTVFRGGPHAPWEGIFVNYFEVASKSDPPIWSSAVAVTKEAIKSIGGFPIGIKAGEDLLTWAKLALKYPIAYSAKPAAVFWLRTSLWGYPTRIPDSEDRIGAEFEKLLSNTGEPNRINLMKYIAMWHQMRASIFLRLGKNRELIYELRKIAKYSKTSFKLYLFLIMALLPSRVSTSMAKIINYLTPFFRKSFVSINLKK
jgi:glycosyltransferase involved in cell wall biosynthesis